MSNLLVTVEQAAAQLNLHPRTVLRYIRDGRLPATRVGKSYRIARTALEAFAGIVPARAESAEAARATCIVELPSMTVEAAERVATFLQAAALTGDGQAPPLHLETAYDPATSRMKLVAIGGPGDVAGLLRMLQLRLEA